MATVRIQVRRGTASQWTSANPTLAAGEMGVESDTNKFKFGNGTTAWSSLSYAAADAAGISEISQDAVHQALTMGDGLSKSYNDGDNTITISVVDSYFIDLAKDAANESFLAADGLKKSYDGSSLTVDLDLATNGGLKIDNGKVAVDTDVTVTKSAIQTLTNKNLENPQVNDQTVTVSGTEINYLTGLTKNISESYVDVENAANDYTDTAISTLGNTVTNGYVPLSVVGQAEGVAELDATGHLPMSQLNLVDAALTGDTTVENLEISGTLVFNGTATEINSTSLSITDPLIYMGEDNPANTVDLGFVSSFTQNSVYQHTGLVRDHATNTWVLFKGVTDEPTTTVNLAQGSLDALAVGALTATSLDIGSVSNTEIGYLNGLSAPIQEQLDLKATLESPTFTGIVSLPSQTITSAMIADGTIAEGDIANSAVTANKLASDAVTTAKIADVNVTTAKIADSAITAQKIEDGAVVAGKYGAGSIVEADLADGAVTSAKIAQGTIVNADVNASAAIDWTKLAISSSVSATEAGYLDGVTSAIQTQIDSKLALAGGELTGDLVLRGNPTTNNMAATKNYVDSLNDAEVTNRDAAIADEADARDTAIESAVTTHNSNTTTAHGVSGAVVGTDNTQTLTAKTINLGSNTVTGTIAEFNTALSDANFATLAGTETLTNKTITSPAGLVKADVGLGNVDNTSDADKPVSDATQTALDLKADLAGPTFTGTATTADLVVNGDFTVNGTNFSASATSITIEDNMVQLAHQNGANTVDLGMVVAYNDGAAKHAGLVRDVSDAKWKLFKGVTDEPSTTVNFGQGSLDDLAVAALTATTVTPSSGVVFSDGTQTKEGVPSRTTILSKTADYTLTALTERDNMIELNSSSPITLSVPTDANLNFPIGTTIDLLRVGSGTVTVAAVTPGTTTINATPGFKLRAQWSSATLMKRAANTWVLLGDLMA